MVSQWDRWTRNDLDHQSRIKELVMPRAKRMVFFVSMMVLSGFYSACEKELNKISPKAPEEETPEEPSDSSEYPGVPKSDIYEVTVFSGDERKECVVFQSTVPAFQPGVMGMEEKDKFPLEIFEGRSISWAKFPISGTLTVEVKILDLEKVPISGAVHVWPSRHGIDPRVEGNTIRFTLTDPGQFSLEIGAKGYRNGLVLFADPPETEIPEMESGQYSVLEEASLSDVLSVASKRPGLYFKQGVHDIGVFKVPQNVKNIYFEDGAWVYGALVMDANPDVKIFGRGILSAARLDYRESHSVEAINQSNNITVEGLVIADPKHFGVRLIGNNNNVHWTKIIGGWVYNTDGISAFEGSRVTHCFIWANDDAIKVYRNDTHWSDIVVWQLNNGGVIQMSWGGSNAKDVTLERIDVLRAEWNKPGFNRALLSCVGNRYQTPNVTGSQENWLIKDVVTETPIPVIFNISPDAFSPNTIDKLSLQNWDVQMPMDTSFENLIIGNDPSYPFKEFIFEDFIFNGTRLTESNWKDVTGLITENLETPIFK